jgi:hypothetical protein
VARFARICQCSGCRKWTHDLLLLNVTELANLRSGCSTSLRNTSARMFQGIDRVCPGDQLDSASSRYGWQLPATRAVIVSELAVLHPHRMSAPK